MTTYQKLLVSAIPHGNARQRQELAGALARSASHGRKNSKLRQARAEGIRVWRGTIRPNSKNPNNYSRQLATTVRAPKRQKLVQAAYASGIRAAARSNLRMRRGT